MTRAIKKPESWYGLFYWRRYGGPLGNQCDLNLTVTGSAVCQPGADCFVGARITDEQKGNKKARA